MPLGTEGDTFEVGAFLMDV